MLKKLVTGALALWASASVLAAGWSFSTSPTLYETEGISTACWVGSTLYVAVNGQNNNVPYGYIKKYANGTWSNVNNAYTAGYIYALAGLTTWGGDPLLFVGGDFQTVGPSNTTVNNVGKFALSGGTWAAMSGTSGTGTDAPVYAIYAFDYAHNSGGTIFHNPMVYVGGSFTNAGGVTSPGIAFWWAYQPNWGGVGAGVNGTVRGVSVDYSVPYTTTQINAVYLAGDFSKTINGINTYNAAKYTGSWTFIGKGLGKVSKPDFYTPCDAYFDGPYVYLSYSVAHIGSVGYFAGIFDGASDKDGNPPIYQPQPTDPGFCGDPYTATVAQLSSANYLTLPNQLNLRGAPAMSLAVKGSTLYVGGGMLDSNDLPVYASKLVSGNWNHLTGSGSPDNGVIAVVAGSTYVYFLTTDTVFAYQP